MDPLPAVDPILLPMAVPIFTGPEVTAIPQKIPVVVAVLSEVYNANQAMVLFCMEETTPPAVNAQLIPV